MGVPPKGKDGCSAILDLLLLRAYQWATELEAHLGNQGMADGYRQRADILANTIQCKYWDTDKQCYADVSNKKYFSQHAQALAILCGLVKGNQAERLAERMLSDSTMAEASIYFKYYVNRALVKAGLGDTYLDQLGIWYDYMKLGMTTWGEDSKLMNTRSDCHAWSASPNIELIRTVLGIDTDAPGFARVCIEPHLGKLTEASGAMPHPLGLIHVEYKKKGKTWTARIVLPQGLNGILIWQGKKINLVSGENKIKKKMKHNNIFSHILVNISYEYPCPVTAGAYPHCSSDRHTKQR